MISYFSKNGKSIDFDSKFKIIKRVTNNNEYGFRKTKQEIRKR